MNENKLKCQICEFEGKNLVSHIIHKHKITIDEYRNKFGNVLFVIMPDSWSEKRQVYMKQYWANKDNIKKVSDIQKNGSSIFTTKYWIKKGLTEEEAKQKVSDIQRKNGQKYLDKGNVRENSRFCVEYWIKRGKSEIEAKSIISEIQSKLSAKSPRFTGHKRTDDQKQRISSSLKKMIGKVGKGKWASHFGTFNGRSKIEIEFYNYIKENIDNEVVANFSIGNYIVDVIKNKKIIEFYGDFWHANPSIFSLNESLKGYEKEEIRLVDDIWKKDEIRISWLKNNGYDVMIIWESDWNKNKQECIEKVKKYLL